MDKPTNLNSDYSAHLWVVQYCFNETLKHDIQTWLRGLASTFLKQSLSVKAVPELIVGEVVANVGEVVKFFGKASSPFCIPVSRQC